MADGMKILHLASFNGNIGDNINHVGFYSKFLTCLKSPPDITKLEIREFFWRKRFFDESFIDLANQFDLIIVGGGNFFELWVENSRTGTSIDIPIDMLEKIRPPILFNALGCDPHMGAPAANIEKFKVFATYILNNDKYFMSVRNDGAQDNLEQFVSPEIASRVLQVPDAGFYFEGLNIDPPELSAEGKWIAINIAGDMLEKRFPGGENHISPDTFFASFASVLGRIMDDYADARVVFIPHIPKDMMPIYSCLKLLPDNYQRSRLSVAPMFQGDKAAAYLAGVYRKAHVVMGMRFHSNVCSLAHRRRTIGLVCYPQISGLYRDIGLPELAVDVQREDFEAKVYDRLSKAMNEQDDDDLEKIDRALEAIHRQGKTYAQELKSWMTQVLGDV